MSAETFTLDTHVNTSRPDDKDRAKLYLISEAGAEIAKRIVDNGQHTVEMKIEWHDADRTLSQVGRCCVNLKPIDEKRESPPATSRLGTTADFLSFVEFFGDDAYTMAVAQSACETGAGDPNGDAGKYAEYAKILIALGKAKATKLNFNECMERSLERATKGPA